MTPTITQRLIVLGILGTTIGMIVALVMADPTPVPTLDKTLVAIWMVESSGRLNPPDGDSGASIGPMQTQRACWTDAMGFLNEDWPYEDARDLDKALTACAAYVVGWQRHLNYPGIPETWARIWNGGPRGPEKQATLAYWRKIQRHL